ncbi:HD-GYP domain-containing protein [Bdellovibrio sp. HCB-162]|uniref:HD-GYP domain-containing protein n=1 Tax=Bdellovibrio sp. HCB-162 TaxID=3394234 RepID=UPI0039BC5136
MDTKFNPDDYVAVSRDEFIAGTQVPVDIFLKLSETNYVMILKEGAKVSFDQMHFPEKAEWLYVRRSDYHKCVGQTLTVAGIVIDSDKISEEKKTIFLSKAADSIFKEIEHLGFDHQALEHSKIVSKSIQTLVENKPDIAAVINMMSNLSDELIRHAMMVSAISVIIAKSMKWTLAQNLEKLALGALLHDVGMKELPDEILEMPRHAMSRDQAATYESHVHRGVEILRSMPSISDDIISIVLEHHENAPGQGYPRRLRDIKINPFARVVALADCFAEIVMQSPNNPHPKNAIAAIQFIEVTLGQPFHKPAFVALKQALQGPAPLAVKKVI